MSDALQQRLAALIARIDAELDDLDWASQTSRLLCECHKVISDYARHLQCDAHVREFEQLMYGSLQDSTLPKDSK